MTAGLKTPLYAMMMSLAAMGLATASTTDLTDEVQAEVAGAWIPFSQTAFEEAQTAGKTILVDVHASWCTTCAAQEPILESLLQEESLAEVVPMRVDFDADREFVEAYQIPRQATILVFQGETETARSVAETDAELLRAEIVAGLSS